MYTRIKMAGGERRTGTRPPIYIVRVEAFHHLGKKIHHRRA